jgi:uncharacterized protein
MNEARTLDQLQAIDLEIDALNQELESVQSQFGETDDLRRARAKVDEMHKRLHQLETAQRELEYESEDIAQKVKTEEAKLYQGRSRSPKELAGIQHEVEHLKGNRLAVEDRLLDLMDQYEKAQAEAAVDGQAASATTVDWEASQAALTGRQADLVARLADRKQARAKVVAIVPPSTLTTYETLRRNRAGRGVSRIERNACQGCRITLPTSIVTHARLGRELIFCPSCGRILVADH